MSKQPYQGVYQKMDFPPFVQREFPKLLYKPGSGRKVFAEVVDKREELAQLAEWNEQPSGALIEDLAVERDVLVAKNMDQAQQIEDMTAKLNALTLAVAQMQADKTSAQTAQTQPKTTAAVSPALKATMAAKPAFTKPAEPAAAPAEQAKPDAPAEGTI